MKNKLTAVRIRAAADTCKLYDGAGLMLVRSKGVGKWVYRYTYAGKRKDMGLGPQSVLSLAEARKLRDKWAVVLAGGNDPMSTRAEETAATTVAEPSFAEMTRMVFEARKDSLRGDGERGRWMSPLTLYILPKIGAIPISKVRQWDIEQALRPIWKTKHPTAMKALRRTRIVLRGAKSRRFDVDPFIADGAAEVLGTVHHTEAHLVATPWQNIPDLYRRLAESNSMSADCLRLAILTVVRSDAIRGIRAEEVEGDIWTVPEERIKGTKRGAKAFRVPLSAEALSIINAARDIVDSGPLFCPSRSSKKGYLTDQALTLYLRRMGIEKDTVHGFRTSFRTWVQDTDACPYEVAETALGHQIGSSVERSYARSDRLEQRRIVMQKWADFVTGKEVDSTVVQFRR